MNSGSHIEFPYRISADCPLGALTRAAIAVGVILDRAHVVQDAIFMEEAPGSRERKKSPAELYDDADSEQREGDASPRNDPLRDARQGKIDGSNVEKPGEAAGRRQ